MSATTTSEERAIEHSHPTPDGGTLVHDHAAHDAEAGHAHHADSQWGSLGAMVGDGDGSGAPEPGDFDSPSDFMDPSVDHEEEESGTGADLGSRKAPRSNLVRARLRPAYGLRSASDSAAPTLFGNFSSFNDWYEVDSFWEGHFLERVAPGAFTQTISEDGPKGSNSIRCLFDHGMDPSLGLKVLGPISELEERDDGGYYEVPLFAETSYVRDLLPGLEAGVYGASFRFEVREENWNAKPKPSKRNTAGVPERTITNARVFEFGPVTFPANPGASAGVRSISDVFMSRLATDPRFFAAYESRVGRKKARQVLDDVPELLRARPAKVERESVKERQAALRRRARALLVRSR